MGGLRPHEEYLMVEMRLHLIILSIFDKD